MSTATTDFTYAFDLAVGVEALPLAALVGHEADGAAHATAMPPLSAEESDHWVEQALFDCYNS